MSRDGHRVVITGMGTVTPAGCGFDRLWDALCEGTCFIGPIKRVDPEVVGVHVDAEVTDFDPVGMGVLSKKDARRSDLFEQYARVAAAEAWEQAGIDMDKEDATRIGTCIGSGCGGLQSIMDSHKRFIERGSHKALAPLLGVVMEGNMAAGQVAITYGLKGQCTCTTTACASGAHAIGEGVRAIRHGYQDAMVVGGAEMVVNELGLGAFRNLTALSLSEDPKAASLPFDARRDGFVLGEGAGVLVLESLEHARARGAEVLGEIVGFGSTCDAYHVTAPDPDGEGPARAMRMALDEAGIDAGQVDYLNAHGTGTKLNDAAEAKALHTVCGAHAKNVLVHSVKGNIGHSIAACGPIEACVTARALAEQKVPGTCGYAEPDPELDVWVSAETVTDHPMRYALSNSLGFGGHNASLCFKVFEE
ncbi:MAG: beta-ketoacyl-ACP synthase II [Coriobacteriales bacterium]|jgi:3-oxoacyl-[acyl-carrier-protein] synthase II